MCVSENNVERNREGKMIKEGNKKHIYIYNLIVLGVPNKSQGSQKVPGVSNSPGGPKQFPGVPISPGAPKKSL